ncbi:MAG TPA: hypothetical protein VF646_18445, partial [Cytophagales bacterium]
TYPISVRVLSFEGLYKTQDPKYNRVAAKTYASQLSDTFERVLDENRRAVDEKYNAELQSTEQILNEPKTDLYKEAADEETEDVQETFIKAAINRLFHNQDFKNKLKTNGCTWKELTEKLKNNLPEILENKEEIAYQNVARAMDEIFGKGKWDRVKRPSKSKPGSSTTWVILI